MQERGISFTVFSAREQKRGSSSKNQKQRSQATEIESNC